MLRSVDNLDLSRFSKLMRLGLTFEGSFFLLGDFLAMLIMTWVKKSHD